MQSIIKFIAQLDRIVSTKDGGGKITLEFGNESMSAIQEIMKLNGTGDVNLAIAVAPFSENSTESPW